MKRAVGPLWVTVPLVAATVLSCAPAGHSGTEHDKGRATASRHAGPGSTTAEPAAGRRAGLAAPDKKELAQQLVSSAENSTLDWRGQYGYIEDIGDGRGYTAGIVGFCSGTHDLLTVVERYTKGHPGNRLARYLPALRDVDGTDSHRGLGPGFTAAWRAEARVAAFRRVQDAERDRVYFRPAVRRAERDGLGTLGQFVYYDAMVMHGAGRGPDGFDGLRERAVAEADTPAEGGPEKEYLDIFLDVRRRAMKASPDHRDTTRIDTAQRRFLYDGNLDLDTPLEWKVYGEPYRVE
ncbi:chitosanase [Streptomyces sp. NPDC005551]|uniref:chitosanase n=1 Tax=Streptomyces sp. NPDC005551 TaxID=3364725 RepID=UPI0036C09A2B